MGKYFSVLLFLLCAVQASGQTPEIHMPLMNDTWKLIAEKTYIKNSRSRNVPVFPEKLVVQINTIVQLPGYIIPVKTGRTHQLFMLSIVPSQQCPYCGQGDVPSLVEVRMKTATPYSDKAIKVKGLFKLNESGNGESEILLINAELVP